MPLSSEDRLCVERLFAFGPAGLLESGMLPDLAVAFVARPDVRAYLEELILEFKSQEDHLARQKFMARRDISRLIPLAIRVLLGKAAW